MSQETTSSNKALKRKYKELASTREQAKSSEETNLASRLESIDSDSNRTNEDSNVRSTAPKPSMPTYGKYNVLKILKENHCLIPDEEQLINAFPRNKRYNLDDIKRM